MDVSVITLTRDHPEYVEALTDSLDAQVGGPAVERILVNNGSPTPTTQRAQQRSWRVVEPGRNTSFSEGNNLAARSARGEFLLLLNDDMTLLPSCLANLWAWRHRADLIGMLILNPGGSVNHAGTRLWPLPPQHIARGARREKHERPALLKCDAITFAAAFVRTDYYFELGGLDERYQYGWEDTDFSCKSLLAGGLTAVAMNAVAIHRECGTRTFNCRRAENGAIFSATWPPVRVKDLLRHYWGGDDFRQHQQVT